MPDNNFQDYLKAYHSHKVNDSLPGKPKRPNSAPQHYREKSNDSNQIFADNLSGVKFHSDLNGSDNFVEDL
jgi:hypothetical protein